MTEAIINKGTGAGGANTNANGLPYEVITDLSDRYNIINVNTNTKNIRFNISDKIFVTPLTKKSF